MNPNNPLQKYFRQPKIYMSLPSKGLFYPPGVLQGDYNNMPVFSMTGMDEIMMKTPDALFNGEATVSVIQSCCPYIKDARQMPSIDVDAVLAAIRIATYGETMNLYKVCEHCGAENDYEFKIADLIDFYNSLKFDNKIQVKELTLTIRPLTYQELGEFNTENFKIRKMMMQLDKDENADPKLVEELFSKMADMQFSVLVNSIETVQAPEGIVTDENFIAEWVANSEKDLYDAIKTALEKNKEAWTMPAHRAQCAECQKENEFDITLDQSNFFVQ